MGFCEIEPQKMKNVCVKDYIKNNNLNQENIKNIKK